MNAGKEHFQRDVESIYLFKEMRTTDYYMDTHGLTDLLMFWNLKMSRVNKTLVRATAHLPAGGAQKFSLFQETVFFLRLKHRLGYASRLGYTSGIGYASSGVG